MSIISIGIPVPDRSALPGQTGSGEEVNLQYVTQNYCANSSNASPTVATPAGGTFSYAPGGISGGADGTIVIANSNPGNYTVTYTVAGVGSANFPINIIALDDASFSYSASAFCADASNQTPTIATPGGTFTTQDITFRPFQMQFDTSGGKTITIPGTIGSSFTVDWGDGNTTTETGGDISHTYASGRATSIVSIGAQGDTGAFGGLRFNNGGSKTDLLEIKQWGSIDFINLFLGFYGCSNMQITATDSPNLLLSGSGSSTSLQQIFFNCTALTGNSYMNNWDVSNVTNLVFAFSNTAFNADISNWDVSNVITFSRCFQSCSNFNQDISSWDMSSVTDASFMFYNATSFNQPIGSWNLTSATNIYQMLLGASSFNQNIGGWSLRTASIPNMGYLLFGTTSMSNANSTDSVVGWANYVYNNTAPFNVSLTNSNINAKFDGARSGLPNFTTAADAKTYLTTTAGWSIN